VEIKGSGVAGTAPELAPLLRARRLRRDARRRHVGDLQADLHAGDHKSQSMYFYDDGLLLKMTGAMVKPSFDLQVGKDGMSASRRSATSSRSPTSALPSATYVTAAPPMLINVPFTIGSYAAIITKLAFDMGNEIALPESISATDGYGQVQISGRNLTGSFNPQRVTVATKDFISHLEGRHAARPRHRRDRRHGGQPLPDHHAGDDLHGAGRSNEKNVGTYDSKFQAAENTGDDEVSIVFT
jgi:hypothetical protein